MQPLQDLRPQIFSGYAFKERQKTEEISRKVSLIKQRIAREFDNPQRHIHTSEELVEKLIKTLESSRRVNETWIYIDMDMFYASIEIRDNPSLADKPVAVTNNNVISTANYIARRFGIKSSMPEFQAEKLCENLVLIPQNLEKYRVESDKVHSIFKEYDSNFEDLGLDEAGLQVTDILKRRCADTDAGRQALATEIRNKIFIATQLTASAGISCNKMLAKLCSKINKPNGQFYLKGENAREYMKNVDVTQASGMSKNEAKLLKQLGINTCGDIIRKKLDLYFGLSSYLFETCIKCALGLGATEHTETRKEKKTMCVSKSFEPTENVEYLEGKVTELTDLLDLEFKRKKLKGKGIEVGLKTFAYELRSRREATKSYFYKGDEINELALTLLRLFYPVEPIRNIWIKIWNLKPFSGKTTKKTEKNKKYIPSEFEKMFLYQSVTPSKVKLNNSNSASVKVLRFQCEHCGEWLTGTENQMNFHLQVCTGYIKQDNK